MQHRATEISGVEKLRIIESSSSRRRTALGWPRSLPYRFDVSGDIKMCVEPVIVGDGNMTTCIVLGEPLW